MNFQPYVDFNYWFYYNTDNTYTLYDKSDGARRALSCVTHDNLEDRLIQTHFDDDMRHQILSDWDKYKSRPEYVVGRPIIGDRAADYDMLLRGCILTRYAACGVDKNPDNIQATITTLIDWLHDTDFYTCPASTIYHDSVPYGLLTHTLSVCRKSIELAQLPTFGVIKYENAILVALVHDWCKIGMYESYMRNIKDDDGKWIQKVCYKIKDNMMNCFGHGVSSVMLINRFVRLTTEEALAIRWHQGAWNLCDPERNELRQANEMYPLVYLLQFADSLACTQYA